MYIGNNQKPKDGEEKLHLVIEGKSDIDVQAGISEIRRYNAYVCGLPLPLLLVPICVSF